MHRVPALGALRGDGVLRALSDRYLWRRLLQVVPTVAGVVVVGFALIHVAPGGPLLALAGDSGDAEYYAAMTERFGLDRPLPEQLVTYVATVARGDLGVSYVQGRPVLALIAERLPATLLLTGAALALSSLVGIWLGVVAAARPGGARDVVVTGSALALYAAPVFWLGQLVLVVLALRTGLFPVQGMTTAGGPGSGVRGVLDVAHHLALPVLVLASQEVAAVARLTRSGLLEELNEEHVRFARAKGLSHRRVLVVHALRRALLPVVTVIGGRVGHLVTGAVVVEVVFGWPGIGRLLLGATQTRDTPVLLGLFLLVGLTVVLANLVTDLAYGYLDPRIRYR